MGLEQQQPIIRDTEHQVHHVIKREMHVEYEDIDQESQVEGMAEDLTIAAPTQNHHSHHHHQHSDSNTMDDA